MPKRPTVLIVLDGLGLNPNPKANAVALAKKPVLDLLFASSPHSTLITHGTRVGLPEGCMGNSEVGHLNIGAGRVVEQWLLKIGRVFERGNLSDFKPFEPFLKNAVRDNAVHVLGLLSEGGVHSHTDHLYGLLPCLIKEDFKKIALHVLTDGRDTPPQSAINDIKRLEKFCAEHPQCFIATVSGRFFGMDRDKRWERVERAYRAIAEGSGPKFGSASECLTKAYASSVTDEFIEPHIINSTPIASKDSLIFFNFRADRMREIVSALTQPNFSNFTRANNLVDRTRVVCFTDYDKTFGLPFLFEPEEINNHLGEVVSKRGLTQLRTAETEKYPHVTYFFNGGNEVAYPGEERSLIPSPRDVKTYDLKPEMSAFAVKDVVINAIKEGKFDLIVVNFANCDMVGHTGVLDAAIKAVETVDSCLGEILAELKRVDGQALIIADHGNCEQMTDYNTGEPHTSHTTYPVPVILFNAPGKLRDGGALCDVAPTILRLIGLTQPSEMSGRSLLF